MQQAYYLIITTDPNKEREAASNLIRAGFDAWVPLEVKSERKHRAWKARETYEVPVIPRLLFAAAPVAAEADLIALRYIKAVQKDSASVALQVPSVDVDIFRARIAELNAATLALAKIGKGNSRRVKKSWQNYRDALASLAQMEDEP